MLNSRILIIFLILSIVSCKERESKQVYYRINKNGKIFSKEGFQKELKRIEKSVSKSLRKATVVGKKIDSVLSHDSIILTFKADVILDDEAIPTFGYLGKKLPSMPLKTLTDRTIDLSNIAKPMVLNFWGVNCAPCIREMPELNKLKKKYAAKVDFYALTFNRKTEVIKFLDKHKFDFTHIVDAGKLKGTIGVNAIPKTLFVNANGVIVAVFDGLSFKDKTFTVEAESLESFETLIQKILDES
jgi:thiol-disulfide isomerase/thioredoxin